MSSTKKGNQWYFGMKVHVGADTDNRIVHTLECTTAKVHDSVMMEKLLHGDEEEVYGDKAYANEKMRNEFEANNIAWKVARKGTPARKLTERDRSRNRRMNKVRAKVEHAFGVVKNLWGFRKVRFRGLRKNGAQIFTLFALSNLFMVRARLAS